MSDLCRPGPGPGLGRGHSGVMLSAVMSSAGVPSAEMPSGSYGPRRSIGHRGVASGA